MDRRSLLGTICGGGMATFFSGCSSLLTQPKPVDFVLVNYTNDEQSVSATVKGEREVKLENQYEISGVRQNQDMVTIREESFAKATNGDVFDVVIEHPEVQRRNYLFEVTCTNNDEIPDAVFTEIRPENGSVEIRFTQPHC